MLLVVLEHDRGEMAEAAREALTFARPLAAALGVELHAALIGSSDSNLVAEAGRHGAETVHVVRHEILSEYGPEAVGSALAELIDEVDPTAVLACATDRGNETMAFAASCLDMPLVTNCVEVVPGDPWEITRMQWGGSLLEDVTLVSARPLLTCGLHVVASEPVGPVEAAVEEFQPDLDESLARSILRDRVVLTQGVTLPTAQVVCGGGRGVGSADGFAILDELAGELGGVVGCSRAVTNLGWRPHKDQVGQTGTRIAPEVYIASGISGAIQHWVGAMASQHILAINTDREANIVAKADWAVIADLHEVIPAITAEIRRRRRPRPPSPSPNRNQGA